MTIAVTETEIFLFSLLLVLVIGGLIWAFYLGLRALVPANGPCPYSKRQLMGGRQLPFRSNILIRGYLMGLREFHNRPFNVDQAAVCRETGRVFPNARDWLGRYHVEWDFIAKRYPGSYVSWGSLTKEKQEEIRKLHGSLEGFETDFSCPNPLPRDITPTYAHHYHGPLYVDLNSFVLVGWKEVPDLDLEVLIVQKPTQEIYITLPKESP
ncbi:MAG: hypothetical protein KDK65_04980 [Chlamydiia bacterium]|nr:hypothetical protein [Chlamydiia bacterium]